MSLSRLVTITAVGEHLALLMTSLTPAHGRDVRFETEHITLRDRPVTLDAIHLGGEMWTVLPVDVVGQLVHAHPPDGFPRCGHRHQRLQRLASTGVCPMARRARGCRRVGHELAAAGVRVAVGALEPQITDVKSMTVRQGLHGCRRRLWRGRRGLRPFRAQAHREHEESDQTGQGQELSRSRHRSSRIVLDSGRSCQTFCPMARLMISIQSSHVYLRPQGA